MAYVKTERVRTLCTKTWNRAGTTSRQLHGW